MKPHMSLADYALISEDKVSSSIYGVVIDATRVYYRPQNKKYASIAKLIDPSWSQNGHPKDYAPFIKVLFMSKNKDEVPHVKRIGSILKFDGGLMRRLEEPKYKILMISWDGANASGKWTVINENEGMSHASLKPLEEENVKELQKFAKAYLEDETFLELKHNFAAARAINKEFDIVGRVVKANPPKRFTKGFTVLKIMDHTDKAYLFLPDSQKQEFANINVKDFVLLKGVNYTDLVSHRIGLEDHGNILVVPDYSLLVKEYRKMMNIFVEGMDLEMAIDERRFFEPTETSVVQNPSVPFTTLKDAGSFSGGVFGKKYRVRIYVIEMGPEDRKEWVKGYCANCHKSFQLTKEDGETEVDCRICKRKGKMVYQVQLFAKDKESRETSVVYRLLLYTYNGKGIEFFDKEPPMNCHRSEKLLKKLGVMYKTLTRYNVYMDCMVERMTRASNSFLQISDTVVNYKPN